MTVQRVLTDVPLREIAEASGLSYGTVRKWAVGLRTPQPEGLRQLAEGLRKRGERDTGAVERAHSRAPQRDYEKDRPDRRR